MSYPHQVKEGKRYINLNPGRLLDLQLTGDHLWSRDCFKILPFVVMQRKPSATGQPTRPTQPFILARSLNWVASYIGCVPPRSGGAIWWMLME